MLEALRQIGAGALTQSVELPLWMVLMLSAYSTERLARMARRLRGLRKGGSDG